MAAKVCLRMKRAALYSRVSTEEQRKHGLSIGVQNESLKAYAEQNGYKIVGLYSDEGISGRKAYTRRPALMQLLTDCEQGKVDLILFTKLDRFTRSIGDYYAIAPLLEQSSVVWNAINEDYETETASGRFKVNIMLSVAQDEADRTSERINTVFQSKREKGEYVAGRIPLGFKIENKHLVVDDSTAPIVTALFDKYIELRNIKAVYRYAINELQVNISVNGLTNLLRNPRNIDIVGKDKFKTAQGMMQTKGQRGVSTGTRMYLFSGILYCAECGRAMTGFCSNNTYYYNCGGRRKTNGILCSHSKTIREDDIETYLLSNILEEVRKHNELVILEEPPQIDLTAIKGKMEKLKDLYLGDLIDKDIYTAEYKVLQSQIDAAEAERPSTVELEPIKQVLPIYNSLTLESQRTFWSRVIKRIYISNDNALSINWSFCTN